MSVRKWWQPALLGENTKCPPRQANITYLDITVGKDKGGQKSTSTIFQNNSPESNPSRDTKKGKEGRNRTHSTLSDQFFAKTVELSPYGESPKKRWKRFGCFGHFDRIRIPKPKKPNVKTEFESESDMHVMHNPAHVISFNVRNDNCCFDTFLLIYT